MKKNVVVLDFDGLFSYPGFNSRIVEPLLDQDREVVIWTFNDEDRVIDRLDEMGLSNLPLEVRIIDYFRYSWLRQELLVIQQGARSADDGSFIQNLLVDLRIPPTEETVRRAIEHYQSVTAFETEDRMYKYPPFLGEDNYLLVESDRARVSGVDGSLNRRNPKPELNLAEFGGHSLIMVPEHPDSWHGLVYPPLDITPEQVMDVLAPAVLDWSGEPIRRDLAVDLGIFQDIEGSRQERIGRPMERF